MIIIIHNLKHVSCVINKIVINFTVKSFLVC